MIAAILSAMLLGASASEPPKFDPGPDLKTLTAFADGDLAAVNTVLSTPMERPRIAALKSSIDDLQNQADGAQGAGQSLVVHAQPPIWEMAAQIKGKSGRETFDDRYAGASTVSARKRWAKDNEKEQALKSQPSTGTPEEQEKRKAELKSAEDLLAQADAALGETDDRLKGMDEARASAREGSARATASESELSAGQKRLDQADGQIRDASTAAKAAIDLLGTEPVGETSTKANQKLQPVLDGGRSVYFQSDVVKHRTQDFSAHYEAFLKAAAKFEDARKTALARLSDAGGQLSSVEETLAKLARP